MGLANIVGQVAWMVVPWFWVLIADENLFATQADGVKQLSIIVGVIAIVFGVLPAIFCRGIDSSKIENRQEISFGELAILFYLFNGDYAAAGNWPAWFSTI